jgi:hypothetical protein
MEFRNRSKLDLYGATIASSTTLAMGYSGAGVWALFAMLFLSQLWKTTGINRQVTFRYWPEFLLQGSPSLLHFGGCNSASRVASIKWRF